MMLRVADAARHPIRWLSSAAASRRAQAVILMLLATALVSACQRGTQRFSYGNSGFFSSKPSPQPKGGGRAVVGNPYWMFGRRYIPQRDPNYDRRGIASWVSYALHGKRTANGELNDATALVAAHPTLPLPSYAEVTNLSNGCRIFLRLNDRGPFVPGRIIDMSPRAAKLLRFYKQGLTRVRLRYWGPAPLNGDDSFERQYLVRYPGLGCRKPPPSNPSAASHPTRPVGYGWRPRPRPPAHSRRSYSSSALPPLRRTARPAAPPYGAGRFATRKAAPPYGAGRFATRKAAPRHGAGRFATRKAAPHFTSKFAHRETGYRGPIGVGYHNRHPATPPAAPPRLPRD